MKSLLNEDQQKFLLSLARDAIRHKLHTGKILEKKKDVKDPSLSRKQGAFVTLKVDGELRGCIGYPLPYKPLTETIIEVATMASTEDYRFAPLSPEEFERTTIEISVLSLPEEVEDIKEIEVGKHGLIISRDVHKGLLLPQVPVEHGWDLETYLRHACLKAGLDEDEWKKGAKIEVFSAQVFSD